MVWLRTRIEFAYLTLTLGPFPHLVVNSEPTIGDGQPGLFVVPISILPST